MPMPKNASGRCILAGIVLPKCFDRSHQSSLRQDASSITSENKEKEKKRVVNGQG